MSDTSPSTRILFSVLGLGLGAFGGMFAHEHFGALGDPTLWIAGGAVVGLLVGLIAPPLLEIVMHLV